MSVVVMAHIHPLSIEMVLQQWLPLCHVVIEFALFEG